MPDHSTLGYDRLVVDIQGALLSPKNLQEPKKYLTQNNTTFATSLEALGKALGQTLGQTLGQPHRDVTNQETLTFDEDLFQAWDVETTPGEIKGAGQQLLWRDCEGAFYKKRVPGANPAMTQWVRMGETGGRVVGEGYSVYFQRGASGEVRKKPT
ncbi:hypothetical protein EDB80DRAFT_348546 [Ilyonectria destructans]|nr:hypothetical protein EDB80DRAFT_348546 [Ilyonectria destructans]